MKQPCVYIMSNKLRSVLYIGVTGDLVKRVHQHRMHAVPGFTDRYNCTALVYYECWDGMEEAIAREKQIKGWRRCRKDALTDMMNKERRDLWWGIV